MKILAYSILIFSTFSTSFQTQGPITKRIKGGTNADLSEFPYIANLDIYNDSGSIVSGCGATLITSRHVLTAAHCFHATMTRTYNATNIVVNYGNVDYDLFTIKDRNVKSYTIHPDFYWVDTSVASFAKIYDLPIIDGSVATPAGWGDLSMPYPGTLEKIDIIISNSSGCLENNDDWNGNNGFTICSQSNGVKSACHGDSGGPLSLINFPGSPQIGIASFVSSNIRPIVCEDINTFDFFTNGFYHIDFIAQTSGVPKDLLLYSTEGNLQEKDLKIQNITGFKRISDTPPEIATSSSRSESSSETSSESSSETSPESSSETSSDSSSETSSNSSSETSSESSSETSSDSSSETSSNSSSETSSESSSETSSSSSESSSISFDCKTNTQNSEFSDFSVTSYQRNKMYDLNNPILLPCPGGNFQFDFDVESEYDTYVAFTDQEGYYSQFGITETLIGHTSGTFTNFSGKKFQTPSKRTSINKRAKKYILIRLDDQTLSFYVDGSLKFRTTKNKNIITQLYLAPFKGEANYSLIACRCVNVVCSAI
ncbi:Chymotrypsin BII [Smittium culicis]|uniref:Chymotrypsin BII n=1 Tax=Smittium culicis TaxID=133412 RepID=A0A1R1YFQ4_9FUNG|nr:Chymotrypsin BII [Smittium culicis]